MWISLICTDLCSLEFRMDDTGIETNFWDFSFMCLSESQCREDGFTVDTHYCRIRVVTVGEKSFPRFGADWLCYGHCKFVTADANITPNLSGKALFSILYYSQLIMETP